MKRRINVAIAGHVDHGKSSLLESITGEFPDKEEFELSRGITAVMKVIPTEWKGVEIRFIDTPGHSDFREEVGKALLVSDGLVLVVAADDGVQARTEVIIEEAKELGLPVVLAVNKMDKEGADFERVVREVKERGLEPVAAVPTSAKTGEGIEDLLDAIVEHIEPRGWGDPDEETAFLVVDVGEREGLGSVATGVVRAGTLKPGDELRYEGEVYRVRALLSPDEKRMQEAQPGDVVLVAMDRAPETGILLTETGGYRVENPEDVRPCVRYTVEVDDLRKARDILEDVERRNLGVETEIIDERRIKISCLGDVQFDKIRSELEEAGIQVEVTSREFEGVKTVGGRAVGRSGPVEVEVLPRASEGVRVFKRGKDRATTKEITTVHLVAEELGLDGLVVNILSEGESPPEALADAIAAAIEEVGIFELYPIENVLIEVDNVGKAASLVYKHEGQVIESDESSIKAIVPAPRLNELVSDLMTETSGRARIRLISSAGAGGPILSVDPGEVNFGIAYIPRRGPCDVTSVKLTGHTRDAKVEELRRTLKMFLADREEPNLVYVGNGPGHDVAVEAVVDVLPEVEIVLVDERETTKEAVYRLSSGKLENVRSRDLRDHGVAALAIARRGQLGRRVKKRVDRETVRRAVVTAFGGGSRRFGDYSRLPIRNPEELEEGTMLQVKDPNAITTGLSKGEVVVFHGWREDGGMIASTLTGNRVIIKPRDGRSLKNPRRFFEVFRPVKPKRGSQKGEG
ncbi:GTP-binding protein [Methanopyrus sp.]